MDKRILREIKKDFEYLKDKAKAILIFGSFIEGNARDIDICIVKPVDKEDIYKKANKYDIHIFEELPLYIKMSIIKNNIILFGDKYELYEYFYFYRKLWEEQKHRNEMKKEEILDMI